MNKIEFINVEKQYKYGQSIRGLNFAVEEGKIYALYGKRRAGLTTALQVAAGLIKPDFGEVRLFGKRFCKENKLILRNIGILGSQPAFYGNLSVEDNLRLLETLREKQKSDMTKDVMEVLGLSKIRGTKANSLDIEQKKRLGLAIAMLHNPEILILDNPFSGFDFNGITEIGSLLKDLCNEYGKTILLASHILSEIEYIADHIGFMEEGSLIHEVSTEDREEINRNYICIVVENVSEIIPIIEYGLGIHKFKVVNDKMLKIFDLSRESGEINTCLNQNGIQVNEIYLHKGTLEEYLMEKSRRY